jgi:hypothetical protein
MKGNIFVILILIYVRKNFVLTLNNDLTNWEENLIYSHLNNRTNLKFFYDKLIQSNGINNSSEIRQKITNEDIQQGKIENKVNISIKSLVNK